MKIRWVTNLLMIGTLGAGTAVLLRRPPEQTPETVPPAVTEKPGEKQTAQPFQPEIIPNSVVTLHPEAIVDADTPTAKPSTVKQLTPQPTREEKRLAELKRYYEGKQKRFEQLRIQLEMEQDPDKRLRLIQQISRHIRTATPATLEWAMALINEDERRIAMEAINKNALVGIGAHLKMDETGFPSIEKTTAISAVGSTGLVEPGDYIIGMTRRNGETVSFEGMPLRKIIKALHGEAGTEIRLLMQRMPKEDTLEPYAFEVPVMRSMIVVQDPF